MRNFEATAYGKWILAGEHAVLRGVSAVVFPVKSRNLTLHYTWSEQNLQLILDGEHGSELQLLVWGVLEKACELKKISRDSLKGTLKLVNTLPVGAGMGASATLCVVITRWLGHLGFVQEAEFYEFARNLENLFHGESSGVDIAVALSGQGLLFNRQGQREEIFPKWQPLFYISYSGKRGVTLDCVNKVKALIAENPNLGSKIDAEMKQAVELSLMSLGQTQSEGLPHLIRALEIAKNCFLQWGLTEGALDQHMNMLLEKGALAVKPTGSGGGGFALSLWQQEPPAELKSHLIRCF